MPNTLYYVIYIGCNTLGDIDRIFLGFLGIELNKI